MLERKYFCTLFDSGYLIKGLAMLRSLKNQCESAHVFVLCMDSETQEILREINYDFITTINLESIETEELLNAKANRGLAEYCWTLSAFFTYFILETRPEITMLTYLDADLFFYSPIKPIFDEIGDNSIGITEHRFSPRIADRVVNGRFCVQWVTFRRDEQGLACLKEWRDNCIEWCYYRLEDGKFGDQKYLDRWPEDYSKCCIIENIGAGVAPWNYEQYDFTEAKGGQIIVGTVPLIFYHFHQLQLLGNSKFNRLSKFYTDHRTEPEKVYKTFENALDDALTQIKQVHPGFSKGIKSYKKVAIRRLIQAYIPFFIKEKIRGFFKH